MTKKKIVSKILTAALTLAMITAIAVPAAAKETVKVTNNRTVMVEGRSYRVLNEGATKFKTSDSKVAKISSKGKITPLKTGYATISMTVKGKKVSKKFLFVDKNGTTNSQTKIKKMLAAPNVKTITLKNTTSAKTYTIADGKYTAKTLNVIAPESKTTINGDFKNVVVKDSASMAKSVDGEAALLDETNKAAGTVKVNGNVDKLTVSSKKVTTTASGTVKNAVVTNGNLVVSKNANVANVSLGGTASLQADTTNKINISVVKGSDVKIGGSATTNATVVLQDGAKANIDAAVKVTVADGAKAEVEFTANAADNGATLVLGKDADVKTTVDKDAKKPITVTKADGTTGTVKPGESSDNNGGGGAIGGGVAEDRAPIVTSSYDATAGTKGLTTYTVSNLNFEDLGAYNITINNGKVNETFNITSSDIDLIKKWSKDVNEAEKQWKSQTSPVDKTIAGVATNITTDNANSSVKYITFTKASSAINGKKVTVTVTDARHIKIEDEEYTCDIILTTDSANKVTKVSATFKNTAGTEYTVVYDGSADKKNSFTITGDTTEKVVFNSVK